MNNRRVRYCVWRRRRRQRPAQWPCTRANFRFFLSIRGTNITFAISKDRKSDVRHIQTESISMLSLSLQVPWPYLCSLVRLRIVRPRHHFLLVEARKFSVSASKLTVHIGWFVDVRMLHLAVANENSATWTSTRTRAKRSLAISILHAVWPQK